MKVRESRSTWNRQKLSSSEEKFGGRTLKNRWMDICIGDSGVVVPRSKDGLEVTQTTLVSMTQVSFY